MSSIDSENRKLRKFGILLGVILGVIAGVSLWRGRESAVTVLVPLCSVIFIVSIIYPRFLTPVHWIMMRISGYLGWINTRILLSLVYYLLFTSVAILFKLVGKDPLSRRFDRESSTYWRRRDKSENDILSHYERQF